MTQLPSWVTDPLSLQHAAPLRKLEIGGAVYQLGTLDEASRADIAAHGARIVQRTQAGLTLAPEDLDPSRALQHLLRAGDPDIDLKALEASITSAHCALAAREYFRQVVVTTLRAGPAAIAANSSQDPQR